jgi:DNA repair exonuclease SbcCD ATPase subunit
MVTYLKSPVKKFTHIVHVADIHIRLSQRYDEYLEVFQRLYDEIDKMPETTLIAVLGDLFHSKAAMSPVCLTAANNFLRGLADRRPVILIPGNHDANLNNKTGLDSSQSVVDTIRHDNISFLRNSGLYIIGNILFNHYSVFDDYTKYINYYKIPKKYLNETDHHIALFHGPVQDAVTDVGYRVASKTVSNNTFDGHHIALLGDIHHHQRLQEYSANYSQPVILYAGSMVQQNHGENLEGHGYVLWELDSKTYTFHEIPNDYGYFTILVENGELKTDLAKLPKKTFLRVKCNQTIKVEIDKILRDIKDKTEVLETVYEKIDFKESEKKNIIDVTNINVDSINDLDYQNQLISNFFKIRNIELNEELSRQVYNINKEMNLRLEQVKSAKNIRWKPKKFQFENMFSYGDGNVIDFTNMRGTVGLFANNRAGKSSILSALCFCIFDKCDRAFKAADILNTQKMSFNCKFNFEIDKIDYFIERKGIQDKKGNVKVDVKFYRIIEGVMEDLNGEARRNTNDVIREYLGTYEDFLLTVLSIQNGKEGSFIDMGQADRKDLIFKFMGITVFDNLTEHAKEKLKEVNALLKLYEKTDYPKLLETRMHDIIVIEKQISAENNELEKLTDKLTVQNTRLIEENKKLVNTGNAPTNIIELDASKAKLIKEKSDLQLLIEKQKVYLTQVEESLATVKLDIDKIDYATLTQEIKKYELLIEENKQLKHKIDLKNLDIDNKKKRILKLEEHKYNPNCEACRSNAIVKELEQTKKDLLVVQNDQVTLTSKFINNVNSIESLKWASSKNTEYIELDKKKIDLNNKVNIATNGILKSESRYNLIDREIETVQKNIDAYHAEKDAIESNKIINQVIDSIKTVINGLDSNIKLSNKKLIELNGKLTAAIEQKNNYETNIKNAKNYQLEQEGYKYYTMAVDRDGIPYELISQALPTLEGEINNILQQIVDFTIVLNTDGKNVIGYISDNGQKWKMELASGLERFVTSLAIRVALLNISNLPRPNFIAIDEGFGCADKENLSSMSALLSHFKSNFEFLWVVSHLDMMKDMVDHQLEIKKEKGFSKIVSI